MKKEKLYKELSNIETLIPNKDAEPLPEHILEDDDYDIKKFYMNIKKK